MTHVIFFALCCCVAAPETRVQTNELQSLSENASASFTPLPPLNILGYTAVFPPMFQLGSGAGGDPVATPSQVSPDPRPDTFEPSVIQTTKSVTSPATPSLKADTRWPTQPPNDRRPFIQSRYGAGRLPMPPSAARRLRSSSVDPSGRTTIPEKLSVLLSSWTSPRYLDQSALIIFVIALIFTSFTLMHMMPGAGRHHEGRPPPFNGDNGNQSFRAWVTDLMHWTLGSERSPHQQVVAVIDQLGGTARELARTLQPHEILNGGYLNGQYHDPIAFLVHGLNPHFSQFDEEYRLQAMTEFLGFQRRSNETISAMLARYELIRSR